jgi:integrase
MGILRLLAKRWQTRKLTSITKQDVLLLKTDLVKSGRAASTINHYINAVSKLFQMVINEWDIEMSNPIIGIKRMSEPQGRMKRLQPDAEKILLSYIPKKSLVPLSSIIIIAIETGMRAGEILGLRWEDIDLSNRKALIRYTKNGDSRIVPLSLRAKNELIALTLNRVTELVFPYCGWQVRRQFVKAVNNAKKGFEGIQNPFIDLRFHDLRHEALSRLSDKGLNVIELAHISGHKTLSMLKRYTHPCHDALLNKIDK